MSNRDIDCPDLGDFKDVAVIEVLVRVGELIETDTPLVTLETDKATMDVPSPQPARSRRSWSARAAAYPKAHRFCDWRSQALRT